MLSELLIDVLHDFREALHELVELYEEQDAKKDKQPDEHPILDEAGLVCLHTVFKSADILFYGLDGLNSEPSIQLLSAYLLLHFRDQKCDETIISFIASVRNDLATKSELQQILHALASDLRKKGLLQTLIGVGLCIGFPFVCMAIFPLILNPILLALAIIAVGLFIGLAARWLTCAGRENLGHSIGINRMVNRFIKEHAQEVDQVEIENEVVNNDDLPEVVNVDQDKISLRNQFFYRKEQVKPICELVDTKFNKCFNGDNDCSFYQLIHSKL